MKKQRDGIQLHPLVTEREIRELVDGKMPPAPPNTVFALYVYVEPDGQVSSQLLAADELVLEQREVVLQVALRTLALGGGAGENGWLNPLHGSKPDAN